MAKNPYLTAPPAGVTKMPPGIPYIVGNEADKKAAEAQKDAEA